jgi:hypothetical protein
MRIIYVLLVLGFIYCSPNRKESKLDKNPNEGKTILNKTEPSNNSEFDEHNSGFRNQGESYVSVTGDGENLETEINNISYSENYLNYQNDLSHYILKTTHLTKTHRGQEGQYSSIKVEIFNIPDSKLISTIETESDDISIFTDFYKTGKYGCCGAEDYYELTSLWKNETFLKFNSNYYYIEIPNARIHFYFGFLSDARNDKNLILGELYFAHSIPKSVPGKSLISHDFKIVNKLIFKAKDKDLYDRIVPFCPSMTLMKNTEEDQLIDYPDHQELRLWSYDDWKGLEGINFNGLKLEFSNDTIIPVEIPIQNGYLFGNPDNFDKIIYIEE